MKITEPTARALRAAITRIDDYVGDRVSVTGHYGISSDTYVTVSLGHFRCPTLEQLLQGWNWDVVEAATCSYYGADRNQDWRVVLQSRSYGAAGTHHIAVSEEAARAAIARLTALADNARAKRRASRMLARGRCSPEQTERARAILRG